MKMKTAFLLACIADISACSTMQSAEEYATEHNYFGIRQCNVDLEAVATDRALERGCVSGEVQSTEGDIQSEKETRFEEGAL